MGKMKIGSAGASPAIESISEIVQPVAKEVEVVVEIPKPVTKEVIVEIPKPVYKIVEVEQVVQKPKIKVEEVQQSVIKPVFTIKQETIVLDQMQRKLDETVSLAVNKLNILNAYIVEKNNETEELRGELTKVKQELSVLKLCAIASVVAGIVAALASLLG
jgi:hypothetical protein